MENVKGWTKKKLAEEILQNKLAAKKLRPLWRNDKIYISKKYIRKHTLHLDICWNERTLVIIPDESSLEGLCQFVLISLCQNLRKHKFGQEQKPLQSFASVFWHILISQERKSDYGKPFQPAADGTMWWICFFFVSNLTEQGQQLLCCHRWILKLRFFAHPSCFRTISQSHYEQSFDQILCGRKLVPSPYFQDFDQRLHRCFKQEKPKDQDQ